MTISSEFKKMIYIERMLEIIIDNMDIKPEDLHRLKVVKGYVNEKL